MSIELNGFRAFNPLSLGFAIALYAMPALSHSGANATPQAISASTQQLNALIEAALANDTSRSQYAAQSQAMRETGVASSTLMDPKLKVGFGGLPVDSFAADVVESQNFPKFSRCPLGASRVKSPIMGFGGKNPIYSKPAFNSQTSALSSFSSVK